MKRETRYTLFLAAGFIAVVALTVGFTPQNPVGNIIAEQTGRFPLTTGAFLILLVAAGVTYYTYKNK